MTTSAALIFPSLRSPPPQAATSSASDSGPSFHDLLNIVNPLQHIPIVSTIYRAVTGDTINPISRLAGDALYGGLWGFVSSAANVAFEEITGKDFGDTVLAFLEGDNGDSTVASSAPASSSGTDTAVASNQSASGAAAVTATLAALAPAAATKPPAQLAAGTTSPITSPITRPATSPASSTTSAASLALINAMTVKGIDPGVSQRALTAYQKSLTASPAETVPVF